MEPAAPPTGPCLSVEGLETRFHFPGGVARAVAGVSFHVGRGEVVGLVGESGCGKSVTALSVMRLVPWPPGRVTGGRALFSGRDLLALPEAEMRKVRGDRISMIFQEPMTSLNPVYTVGRQIAEVFSEHRGATKREAWERAVAMLEKVRIPAPAVRAHDYPHQMSGGMRQRVMIAMALACSPELLIADEPTTALDVTIQAEIIALMAALQEESGTAVLLITHNLGLVAQHARRVIVMYAGRVVEEAQTLEIFETPLHPYTVGLLASIPRLGRKCAGGKRRLAEIPGVVPDISELPGGCVFNPRCPLARALCTETSPTLREAAPGHLAACWAVSEGWT